MSKTKAWFVPLADGDFAVVETTSDHRIRVLQSGKPLIEVSGLQGCQLGMALQEASAEAGRARARAAERAADAAARAAREEGAGS